MSYLGGIAICLNVGFSAPHCHLPFRVCFRRSDPPPSALLAFIGAFTIELSIGSFWVIHAVGSTGTLSSYI